MKLNQSSKILSISSLMIFCNTAVGSTLWSIYEPACNSSGIDPEYCLCILDDVVQTHGEAAARYVGLDMTLQYDEAGAILAQIGEDKAAAASITFEEAQNKACSPGRLARLKGTYQGNNSSMDEAAVVSADLAGNALEVDPAFQSVDGFVAGAPVIDLRHLNGEVVADVSAVFHDRSLLTGGTNGSLGNFMGFYRIVNVQGSIDTDGDGSPDIGPGDEGYAAEVQRRALPTKLYVSQNAGLEQVLGEARFPGGGMYAFYVRMKGDRDDSGLANVLTAPDGQASVADLMRRMQAPQHLYFVFPGANPDGAGNLADRGDGKFVFNGSPESSGSTSTGNDAEFSFRFGM